MHAQKFDASLRAPIYAPIHSPSCTHFADVQNHHAQIQHTQARLDDETETDVALDVADEVALDEPAKYAVILHNDDYTTMDFVVAVLMQVFGHDLDKAVALMYQVHEQGSAVAAVYVKEIAETKAAQVVQLAENAQYPLLATIEPAL